MSTNTARLSALETAVADQGEVLKRIEQMLAGFNPQAPAMTEPAPVAAKADSDFVTWVRDTAEARKARKGANAELVTWLKGKNLPIGGTVWALAKQGERKVTVLRKAAKADAAARKA